MSSTSKPSVATAGRPGSPIAIRLVSKVAVTGLMLSLMKRSFIGKIQNSLKARVNPIQFLLLGFSNEFFKARQMIALAQGANR